MARKYHTLLERSFDGAPWGIAFGDYDRETVDSERQEYRANGAKASNLKMITTGARQGEIDSAVSLLNAKYA